MVRYGTDADAILAGLETCEPGTLAAAPNAWVEDDTAIVQHRDRNPTTIGLQDVYRNMIDEEIRTRIAE